MEKQQEKYRIVTIKGEQYHVFDCYYDGHKRRCYGANETELKAKISDFLGSLIENYKANFPKSNNFADIAEHFVHGFKLFRINVYSPNFVIGDYDMAAFEAEHYKYMVQNIIKRSLLNKSVENIEIGEIEELLDKLTHFYDYETIREIAFLVSYTFQIASEHGYRCIDFKDVNLPQEYKGVTKNLENFKRYSDTVYFFDKKEYECMIDYCAKTLLEVRQNESPIKVNTDIMLLTLTVGADVKQLIGLPYSSIDVEKGVVHFENKDCPIEKEGIECFKNMEYVLGVSFKDSDKKFGVTFRNNPMPFSRVIESFKKITKHLALPQFTVVSLYRSYALLKMNDGVSVENLSETMADFNKSMAIEIKKQYLAFQKIDFKSKDETR